MSSQPIPRARTSSAYRAARDFGGAGIGDIGRMFGLTARAIRFYEECGLVSPRRDRTNRRCFSREDRARLEIISILRQGDLRIPEIAQVLAAAPGERRRLSVDLLTARLSCLSREMDEARCALERANACDLL
jgi:DNA-binding transcriptional MerR regulator